MTIKNKLRKELNEISLKQAVATGLMGLSTISLFGQEPKTNDSIQQTKNVSMYGSKEQRELAKQKRLEQQLKNEEKFINNAIIRGFYEKVSEEEFNKGCMLEPEDPNVNKDYVYRVLNDGKETKVKVNLKKYRRFLQKDNKGDNLPDYGQNAPSFKKSSCGITNQNTKQDKKNFKK